ncbi:Enoyl-CoA hydratase/isomerase [Verticillium dahliae VDG1]|nr:Enoyl-CoA hydratase/isomerase [Verticillium dahliae VDG1]
MAPLFGECTFAFVPSSLLTPTQISSFTQILEKHGGTVLEPADDGSIRIEEDVTHIISNTIDFRQFTDSQAYMIPVVTHQWISSSLHRGKQAQVRPHSPDPRMIFSQVTLSCADLPVIDKETIIGATLALGGMESPDVSRLTTHICALTMDHPKCQMALQKKLKVKIVLPHWFEDCFKLGKRIDETPYLLPDPEILLADPSDDIGFPETKNLEGATDANPSPESFPPVKGHVEPSIIFQGKAVMISSDLNITKKAHAICRSRITQGGGQMVAQVEDCDMYICQYRDGPDYIKAAQLGKDVGNLAWLMHLISRNEWTSPLRRLLHYPVPRGGIDGFQDLRICAAKDWGIETINHLWIEESYAKCEKQPVTVGKYAHFPPRTNLGEIIGQTFFDEAQLRDKFYPGGAAVRKSSPRAAKKRKILDAAQDNAYKSGPAEGAVIGRQEHRDFDVLQDEADERRSSKPDGVIKVMLTGFSRWLNDKHKEDVEKRKLRELGIHIVSENQPCDYLAAPFMVRTVKFLRTLAKGVTILSSDFIETALTDGTAPDPKDHILEKKLWPKFEAMAERGHMEPRIVAADWLLDVAMTQRVSFDEKYLAVNFFKN